MALTKAERRSRIRHRIRKVIKRHCRDTPTGVFRSNKEIYAQLIDDVSGTTLAAASSREKDIETGSDKKNTAEAVGKKLAELAKAKGIGNLCF